MKENVSLVSLTKFRTMPNARRKLLNFNKPHTEQLLHINIV